MPTNLFLHLNEEKRAKIRSVALREFAQHTFNESSTNRIVENAGIAKGSLFKYFHNKKDLYFYMFDYIFEEFAASLEGVIRNFKGDLFERTIKYAEFEFSWYLQNSENYMFVKKALEKENTEIIKELEERYAFIGDEVFYELFSDINAEKFKGEKEKTLNILKWFLKGFNEEFIQELQTQDMINELKDEYLRRLVEYMEILKEGLNRGGDGYAVQR